MTDLVAGPKVSADVLSPVLRKHVDPAAPEPLRGMGARLLVPASPHDAVCMLYLLSFDPDERVRAQALATAQALPDKVSLTGLRDDTVPPAVLGWWADQVAENERLAELVILNPATPDEAMASIAGRCSEKNAELISQNQLRVLRHEPLLRALLCDAKLSGALRDGVADFAIRSGIYLADVPALVDAHRRIHGDVPPAPPGETAAAILAELSAELSDELEGAPLEEGRRATLTQRIMNMSVAEKIKLGTLGNKEARGILLRDTNKLVCVAAAESPRITEGEIVQLTNSRTINEEVLRVIFMNREWIKLYQVKLNLVKNPKTPLPTALRFLPHVRPSELKDLQNNRNVPTAIRTAARNLMMKTKR
ncbi:hypothetical protein [Vulgatibacter incomptus]|uniref:Uncharacterized protein n=1 Tax=Vulgatibacter incomptus TaxID=1391653 RepID=A0A0K1PDT8_9BACT|nr:hypothetical protein [Vulgatibacter incomptus]AKU91672.1 hypothetical protein AKJ08_2059 [Vulgatibacter incomptus]